MTHKLMILLTLRTLIRKLSLPVACILVSAGLGALAGLFVGQRIALQFVKNGLGKYASRVLTEREAASSDARVFLGAMNASPHAICSQEEGDYFRELLLGSEYVKGAGRIQNNSIVCSTMLGALSKPFQLPRPDFSQSDGTGVYLNLEPFRLQGRAVITLRFRGSYVVMSPFILAHLEPSPMHYIITETDIATNRIGLLRGESPGIKVDLLNKNSEKRIGDTFYATRCSDRFFSCVSAFISIPEALNANRNISDTGSFLGTLFGATLGLMIAFFYRRNQSLEQRLLRAILEEKLQVLYQPIIELGSRRIVGAEALVRWVDDDDFVIGPDIFIKIAEERGFIRLITKFVLCRTIQDFALMMINVPDFHVNVNITGSDLADPEFLPMLEGLVSDAGIPAASLGIEITESSTARHQVAKQTINSLRASGHKVYIDDFGTGYSNLAYLHDLAVDAIKIDRTYTKAIGTGAVTVEILPQILAIARALGLQVVIEGIETPLQAEYFAPTTPPLLAQGWLFGKPMTRREFSLRRTRVEPPASPSVTLMPPTPGHLPPRSANLPAELLPSAHLRPEVLETAQPTIQ